MAGSCDIQNPKFDREKSHESLSNLKRETEKKKGGGGVAVAGKQQDKYEKMFQNHLISPDLVCNSDSAACRSSVVRHGRKSAAEKNSW